MKIAFLNPWRDSAENQVCQSGAIAARRIGHELVECANSQEVEALSPDFVLGAASTQPKLNDIPQYALVHAPRDVYLSVQMHFDNIVTADGYMTISDSLQRFISDLTFATGQSSESGYYFNSVHRQEIVADLDKIFASKAAKLTHFGTNWDKRRAEIVTRLANYEGVQVFGPESSWKGLPRGAYGGMLPFDGNSVQLKYAENGVGLCLLSQDHYRDDIVSSKPFEIVSVGAVAICPDIPWLRRHFGDSLYYFDQWLPTPYLVKQILLRFEEILGDPATAAAKALRAKEIFDQTLCAEILLANAVEYHNRVSARRNKELSAAPPAPLISVIVRCGSRSVEIIRRAIESVARQSYGRFEIILVRHCELDVSELTALKFERIETIRVLDAAPGKRSTSLWAGLAAVRGEYFAVLDDDDWLFHDHFERLFHPLQELKPKPFFAYSGVIEVSQKPEPIPGGGSDCRRLFSFGIQDASSLFGISTAFCVHCFVASSDLLTPKLLQDPQLATCEDTYLILSLLMHADPRFSYAATAVYQKSDGGSDFWNHPLRVDDELTVQMRLRGGRLPRAGLTSGYDAIAKFWRIRHKPIEPEDPALLAKLPQEPLRCLVAGFHLSASNIRPGCKVVDSSTGECTIETPSQPWAYASEFAPKIPKGYGGSGFYRIEVQVAGGPVGIGVLNPAEDDFLVRLAVKESSSPHDLILPIAEIAQMGRLVIQNWDTPGTHSVHIHSIALWGEVPLTRMR